MQSTTTVREQMFSMIALWQQSGLTQKAFCLQHQVRYHVFHYWYKVFRQLQPDAKQDSFIAVNIGVPEISAAELLLPDGRRLLFHQPVSAAYLKSIIS